MELYLSLSCYGGVSTRQALEIFSAAGVQRVELAIGVKADPDAPIAIQSFGEKGMKFRAHHAFVWEAVHRSFNLAGEVDFEDLRRRVNWLGEMGIMDYSVHPGQYRITEKDADWGRFLRNLEWLINCCQAAGITLAVETMYPMIDRGKCHFLGDMQSIDEMRKEMSDLKWVLDLSHLNLWKNWDDRLWVMDQLKGDCLEVHISDNDGRRDLHTAIGDRTWWLPFCDRLPQDVPFVLETRLNRRSAVEIRQECDRVSRWSSLICLT